MLEQADLISGTEIEAPTKVFLYDASVILYKRGFEILEDRIVGYGEHHHLNGNISKSKDMSVEIDSIAVLTYYDTESTGGSAFASFLLGLYGGIITPLSIYCLSCPKCCFGSCPTVYTFNGQEYILEAELFSYSISRYFQESDLDKLTAVKSEEATFKIRISNEALETHYIDKFTLLEVIHPGKTQVYPTYNGNFVSMREPKEPLNVKNLTGNDVTHLVGTKDNLVYRSGNESIKKLSEGKLHDRLDLLLDLPAETESVNLLFRLRNTLLTTVLFYDLVLASQGFQAVEWTQKMQTDYLYAHLFNKLFKSYSGIKIKSKVRGEWVFQSKIGDIGPIAWKEIAVSVPVEIIENRAEIRIEFFPDNFMIDYIAYEPKDKLDPKIQISELKPTMILDDKNDNHLNLIETLAKSDNNYLITNPGESYFLIYENQPQDSLKRSVFVHSKGYYTEWIRGNWLASNQDDYKFDLFNVNGTIEKLQQSWLENRALMEETFFETRIPLVEDR
jgi:hypothetical protein